MKTLIVDSGATKTDWLFIDNGETTQVQTQGLHPSTIDELSDSHDMSLSVGMLKPSQIYFYGTGCGNPVADEKIRLFLGELFPNAAIYIDSDLTGSAMAFYPKSKGVVLILGTGAICSVADHGKVVQKSASLGYAIGDEGSAADLGRRILKIYFRNESGTDVIKYIDEKLDHIDYASMMNRIYTSKKPNRELASIAGKVLNGPYPKVLDVMIQSAFQDFIDHQLNTLKFPKDGKIIATGKVAHVHQNTLLNSLHTNGYTNAEVRFPVIASFREKILSSEITF